VVGASNTPASFGERTLSNLGRFTGRVYGVNPKYGETMGHPCFPSLEDLPEVPDCVIVAVAARFVEATLAECAERGVGGAVIYASGFDEVGTPEGKAAQARLVAQAREAGIRLVGPNCIGLVNTHLKAGLNFMPGFHKMDMLTGPVSLVSQSGALGYTMYQGMERGVGIGHYLAAGNSADVDVCDYISYLADDPETKVIACLFEGVKNGERFLQAADRAFANGKPLLLYKMGTSEVSKQTALSHTGTLVGSNEAYLAAFRQAGAVSVDHLDGLLEMANFFARSGEPRSGKGVGVMATSGGAAVVMADKAEQHGVALPPLGEDTAKALQGLVPGFGSVANPADLTAEVLKTKETFVGCFEAFAADPSFDALIVPLVFANPESSGARTPVMSEIAKRTGLPIVGVWLNDWLEGPGSRILDADDRASIFRSSDHCFEAIAAWQAWHAKRREAGAKKEAGRISPLAARDGARALIEGLPADQRSPDEIQAKQLLSDYGVRCSREVLAGTSEAAAAAADDIGYPVAIKIVSPDILHKTEAGGVRLGVVDSGGVAEAFRSIMEAVGASRPQASIDGVVVQEMIGAGVELMLGARVDAQFGPLVVVGFGGMLVEILKDTATSLAPFGAYEARRMLTSLRGFPLLTGYRGSAPADLDVLADLLARFSEFVADTDDLIEEVDVNPVIVNASGAVCVDALIVKTCSGGEE